ncbi:hypothetical protein L2E82_28081 [Cichorium intybus]|uniref:Uncharacterized protein n=1 Tax=Cichorium intybus TaxID=13427 RepID=A0ACB9CV78_CICIN|nr:hypothetical protein L2E82_28081 [Cichorium intybus]
MTATTGIIVSTIVPMVTPWEDVNSQGDSVLEGIFFGFDMIALLSASIIVILHGSFFHHRERSMMKFLSIIDKEFHHEPFSVMNEATMKNHGNTG